MNISDKVNYKSMLTRKCRENNKQMPKFDSSEFLDGFICQGTFENTKYYTECLFNKEEHAIQDICRQVLNEHFGCNFELVFEQEKSENESDREGEESYSDF